jgi:predicted metal-dependent TIM-barrel fold hydrolase
MPTHDSEHEVKYNNENRPFVSVSRKGALLPEVLEVLSLIAQNDLTLATGHVTPEEALMIIREAKKRGVQRIIVTHPLLGPQFTYMSLDQIQEAAKLGAFIEHVAGSLTRPAADRSRVLEAIRRVGPARTFISSDSGLVGSPNHADALAQAAKALRDAGFGESDLNLMFKENPARLVKLPLP